MDNLPYSFRVYRLGLSPRLRAEIIEGGRVIARAEIAGEGPPEDAVALAREWAASIGYPTPEPPQRAASPVGRFARPFDVSSDAEQHDESPMPPPKKDE